MKQVEYYTTKDGPGFEVLWKKTTDTSKPKIWVEGFEYKFNSDITKVQRYEVKE